MSKVTISLHELMRKFPNEESARLYLEDRRWKGHPTCPKCESSENQYKQIRDGTAGYYRCHHCKSVYTVRTGTIFERSHIPLDKWLITFYLMVTARKGISSLQLSHELGITQKSAWFMQHRIREACGNGNSNLLKGSIEADGAYFGGKEKNKHESKKLKAGRGTVGKVAVLGMRERGGSVKGIVLKDTTAQTVQGILNSTLAKDSILYTDEHKSYQGNQFKHKIVNHSAKKFVDGMAHTNGIESVWAVLKRGYYGTHHNFSEKHLQKYIDEFTYRLNGGNVKNHTMERINTLLDKSKGKRLTYKHLKSGESETLNNKKGIAVMQEETKNKIKTALKVGSIYSGGIMSLGNEVIHEHQNCEHKVSRNYKIVTNKINSTKETE